MVGNKQKRNTMQKLSCPICGYSDHIREHGNRNGEKRYRCMNPEGKHVFPKSKLLRPNKKKIKKRKTAEQYQKELEIILVWLSDFQTLNSTAGILRTTRYYVKKAIKENLDYFFYDEKRDCVKIKTFSTMRRTLRRKRYDYEATHNEKTWIEMIQCNNSILTGILPISEDKLKAQIEQKYGISVTFSKVPPRKDVVEERPQQKNIQQLVFEYRVLLDWLANYGGNLYRLAKKHGVVTHGEKYKTIEEIIKSKFQIELGVCGNRMHELRWYIKDKREKFENPYKTSDKYINIKLCELFKLALFDPESDFFKGVFRTEEEIINEYAPDKGIVDSTGFLAYIDSLESNSSTTTPQTA